MIVVAVLCGVGTGVGLWALLVWAMPPRPSLAAALATLRDTTPPEPALVTAETGGWAVRWGRPAVRPLMVLGLPHHRALRDLTVLGRSRDGFLAQKAVLAAVGLLLPTLFQLFLLAADIMLPWEFPFVAGLVCAVVGFFLPDLAVRREAERRRASFRHALSSYLNLIRVTLAGGAGVDGALTDAADIGQGWAFTQLRRALNTAKLTRTTPWATLRQLGEELGVRELVELSASVSLAGTEGAKVRASLAAKAAALRTHELTAAEGEAHAATERMSLPVIALFAGFLLFIGYPALAQVLSNL